MTKNPIKIYLGDLTYTTVAISTESFPLNIGYIAAYCKKKFGNRVDITLFKYIDELDEAINQNPPDILGLSNYAWNQRVDIELFRMLKTKNPNALTVWGGPNFPLDLPSQENFLNQNLDADIYVPIEGEIGFSNIVERALECNSVNEIREKVLSKPIEGCISRKKDATYQFSPSMRTAELDNIPSPYLTGILDKFFDGKLSPMIQTNRGCPFSCSFCVDGSPEVMKVNNFSIERVNSEINYIATHVPEETRSMFISDLNFGMIPRDLEICKMISQIQKKYNYPLQIQATTGKNSKEKIIDAIKLLNGALRLWMSVQSMDQQVLANIKRDNISVDHILALAPEIKKSNLRTSSEVILGLPGESYQSHIETLQKLVRAKINYIVVYTCMLLNGSEMNTPEQRKKWDFNTKYRILPRDFTKLSNGKIVLEVEEVVVGTNTLLFDEYLDLRILSFAIYVTNIGVVFDALLKFLRERDIDVFELFRRMAKHWKAPENIKSVFQKFRQDTIDELWDSPEELIAHYQKEEEYKKLLDGTAGINILQYYHTKVTAEFMDDWTEYTLHIAYELLQEKKSIDDELNLQFNDISNYCRGLGFNTLGQNRLDTIPESEFHYDLIAWLKDDDDLKLEKFRLTKPSRIKFILTLEQYKLVQDKLNIFGNTTVGRSQAIKRTPLEMLWRKPHTGYGNKY